MITEYSDEIVSQNKMMIERANKNYHSIKKIINGEMILDAVNSNIIFSISGLPPLYSLPLLELEIRNNILNIDNDNSLFQYLYYLIKIHNEVKNEQKFSVKKRRELEDLLKNDLSGKIELYKESYSSIDELILHCYYELQRVSILPIEIWVILKKEFGFKCIDWIGIIKLKELPSFFDVKKMFIKDKNEMALNDEMETIPDYKYKGEVQKLAWLHELGILKTVLDKCKEGETLNLLRAAHVIHSFTAIKADTIRKGLEAIYQPNNDNKKNHPLNNPSNNVFVADMAAKFKLNKEKEN